MKVDSHSIIELLQAAMAADYTKVRRVGGALARGFAQEGDIEAAKAIQALLKRRGVPLQASGFAEALPRDAGSRLPLIEEGAWPTTPLMVGSDVGRTVARFLEDAKNIELLSTKGVATRLGLLLFGPPGTGKTLLAGHIAAQLERPIYLVRLDSLISSRLGETAKNIRGVFEFVPQQKAVLFLDEMDAIAKLRDDRHELGELKRVVNTVLQGLDSLSDDVVVIGATNHPHLLDPAIWRRFPYKAELSEPDQDVRAAMWRHFLSNDETSERDAQLLASMSDGLSGADIENIALAVRRRAVLDGREPGLAQLLLAIAASGPGNPQLVDVQDLSAADKRTLTQALHERASLKVKEIAEIVGVSRQMAHRYLKEVGHG
jgi:MoxR-like ATPase